MSFPRYAEYKDSGVRGLGPVPAGWHVRPLKALASCNDEVLPEGTDPEMLIEYVEISGVTEGQGIVETASMSFGAAPSRARRIVRDGDVLISTVRTYLRAIATVSQPPERLIASTGFAVVRPRAVLPRFLGYMLHCEFFMSEVIARSVGISYPAINASELMALKGPVPSTDEQAAIAAFLDRETAKIDALVEEQMRLIELLKEKRQAVISQAVTKGLDPNVPMKDSGVAWLGQVPAHWPVKRLKDHGALVGGAGFPHEHQGRDDKALPFYKVASLDADSDGRFMSSTHHTISPETAAVLRAAIVPSGAILWAKIGAALMLNRRRITTVPCCIDNNMTAYLPGEDISTEWAYYWTSLLDLGQFANPGAVPSLSEGYQATLPLLVPPPREQAEIAGHIDAQTAAMESLSAEAIAAVELLQERRSALISAAVTGKIDVRGLGHRPHGDELPSRHDESHDLQCERSNAGAHHVAHHRQ